MISFFLKLITAICFFGLVTNSYAAVVQSITIPISVGYESNPIYSSSNEQSISRVTATPSYSITSEQGPNQWFSNASFSFIRSSDQTISQDRNDPTLNLGWKRNYETGQFGITGLLNDQSTRVSELIDSGLVSGDNTKNIRTLSANWLNNISDRTSLTLSSSATVISFSGQTTTGLVDSRNESFNAKLGYTINEKLQNFIQISASNFKPEGASSLESKTKSVDLGIIWNASEKLNISASIGSNEVQSGNNVKNENWQAGISTQYITLRTNSNLGLSRSQSPSSTGRVNETDQLTADWSYNLSERDNFALGLTWGQNLTLNKTKTKQFSANYTRELSLSWDFRLSAEHKAREDPLTNTSSSSIMASIIYKLTDF